MSHLKTVLKNVGFVYSSVAISKALGIVSTVILARLLDPVDFGIISLAGFVTGLVSQFADFGIGMSLVQRKDDTESARNAALQIYILNGFLLYIITFFSAPFASTFFKEPMIQNVIRISAFGLVLNSFGVVNRWLLIKSLEFKKIAKVDVISGAIVTITTIILAYYGFSFWSIVYGSLVGAAVEILLLWTSNPWRPNIEFNKENVRNLFHFGKFIFISTVFVFFIRNIDNVAAGKVLGTITVGYYMLAFKFGNYSTTLITHVVSTVLFPTFSKMQDDLEKLRKGYLMQLKYISMISIPMAFGTFAIAREFVIVILGDKWTASIQLLKILCFLGLFRSLGSGAGSVYLAVGKPELSTKITGVQLLFILIFIYPITSWFGIIGLCVIMTIAELMSIILQFYATNKILSISNISQLKLFSLPTLSSVLMTLVIYIMKPTLSKYISIASELGGESSFKPIILIVLIITGVFIYSTFLYSFTKGEVFVEIKEIISKVKSG